MKKVNKDNIVISRSMMRSAAFRELSRVALLVLFEFLARRRMAMVGRPGKKHWVITNNGEITLTYREAQRMFNISSRTFTRAIDKLIEHGFISISNGGNGAGGGNCTTYFLDNRWEQWKTPKFIEKKRDKSGRKIGFMKKNSTDNSDYELAAENDEDE